MAKLTDRQRKRIIAEYVDGGISQRGLAKKYSVSVGTISKILSDEKVVQKCTLKKEEDIQDMLAFLDNRKQAAMSLIDSALGSAKDKMKKASLKDTMGAIKILSEVFGDKSKEGESPTGASADKGGGITFIFSDTSMGDEGGNE